jgi:GrpB-like predicted nucleotidyltransferase (UPF0157 family)
MTAEQLVSALRKRGVEISRRSLFAYQKIDPREAPEFGDVDAWARFIRERKVYESGPEGLPMHNLYLCPCNSPALANHLAVRDYLRTHPEAATEYVELKKRLAKEFPDDIDARQT